MKTENFRYEFSSFKLFFTGQRVSSLEMYRMKFQLVILYQDFLGSN